jgi:hypothetical protein
MRTYTIVSKAVEDGVAWGYARAHKHTETPAEESLKAEIVYYTMLSLEEVVHWPEDGNDPH